MRRKVDGRRLPPENPLKGDSLSWPREKNVRRPIASHARFLATLGHADAVDPTGALGCVLSLARYTGRREGAICGLWASDVLRTRDQLRAALAAEGMDAGLAEHMPHGATR